MTGRSQIRQFLVSIAEIAVGLLPPVNWFSYVLSVLLIGQGVYGLALLWKELEW